MNKAFFLQQIQKTSNLDASLISRQYKLNLMADYLRVKYENPKTKQSEIANPLGKSASILQRYRNEINMLSPYRIQPNITNKRTKEAKNTDFINVSLHEPDVKRPQLTSNDLKITQTKSNKKSKNALKTGSVQQNFEIDNHYLNENLDNNDIKMDLAMQRISTDKTVTKNTIENLKEFNSQSLSTQAKKGEQLVSMMPAIKKAFDLMGDDIVDLSSENDALKSKIGDYDEKWLEESKSKMLKEIDDEKRANLIMSRMKKQMEKH